LGKHREDRCFHYFTGGKPGRLERVYLPTARQQQDNASGQCCDAESGLERDVMPFLFACLNRTQVDYLFLGRKREASQGQSDQAEYDQDNAQRFHHASLLLSWKEQIRDQSSDS
jgi:hypothetical protein